MVDENGKERSFNAFKQLVLDKHPTYNQNYLQAEYQTAKASGQMAAKWAGFQRNKTRYPYLKYRTVGDEHVRDDHAQLDGFIAHIDDPIWDKIYPPNDWRCRCYVVQTNQAPEDDALPDLKFMKPAFSVNVGKTGVVFNDQAHPYFIIPKKDEKRMQVAFESMKLRLAYGKAKYTSPTGSKVFVHPFADPVDLYDNYSNAVLISNTLKRNVKLRPHIDGAVLLNTKNPEYLINNKIGERKAPQGLNFRNVLNKAVKQGSEVVVIDLIDNPNAFDEVRAQIIRHLRKPTNYVSIKEVILISKDRKTTESIKRNNLK
ncbi:phage minor head protein [Formosa sp. A9]|uniref:phage minor head protein n=1 Tax=Formosa sp. A9 TaxID=3442641 RepID=UPI003EC0A623